jgi:hypothetical protein
VVDAQDMGVLHRQELVSMIPPILLNIPDEESSLHILDLCAAPGSKSLQILDRLESLASGLSMSRSLLVCNDSNRDHRLLTVARRSRLQNNVCLILNSSDGRHFPTLRKWGGYKLKFDRVLADVPCSGDGTLRKLSSTEWQQWNVKTHLALHKLQLRLLCRALELVKKGGRVVYSTCSLDPIENEAVVVSAIARMGGPSLYRILSPPKRLENDIEEDEALADFEYSPGSTQWTVPDPKFSAENPALYHTLGDVPKQHKRAVLPSMFPPSTRKEDNILVEENISEEECAKKLETAKFYGDVMSQDDIKSYEAMLLKCCRILPQHFDSGGFFCAIIERIEPTYYAVSYPAQRGLETPTSHHHGRIYVNVEPTKVLKEVLLKEEVTQGQDVFLEGHPTLQAAQDWLRKHDSFVQDRSTKTLSLVDNIAAANEKSALQDTDYDRSQHSSPQTPLESDWRLKPPLYTPTFQAPHPDLIQEFCDYYGLYGDEDEAREAGVSRFPTENLVLVGGGEDADLLSQITSWDDGVRSSTKELPTSRNPRSRFAQLTLVSEEIRSLYKGGAQFSPIHVGMAVCSIPTTTLASSEDDSEKKSDVSARSVRYALMDKAVDLVGQCATKRVVCLSLEQSKRLLKDASI